VVSILRDPVLASGIYHRYSSRITCSVFYINHPRRFNMCKYRGVQFCKSDCHEPYLMRYDGSVTVTRVQANWRRTGMRFPVKVEICPLYSVLIGSDVHIVSYAMDTEVSQPTNRPWAWSIPQVGQSAVSNAPLFILIPLHIYIFWNLFNQSQWTILPLSCK
jgi:hypothetical protein